MEMSKVDIEYDGGFCVNIRDVEKKRDYVKVAFIAAKHRYLYIFMVIYLTLCLRVHFTSHKLKYLGTYLDTYSVHVDIHRDISRC